MADGKLRSIWRHIRALTRPAPDSAHTDRQLLERFAGERDESAFAVLIDRHGAMVRNLCRRVLRDDAAADDAFQATFLVLASKAGNTGWRDCLGSWLWAVAYRVASKAKVSAQRRLRHERRVQPRAASQPENVAVTAELRDVLDTELSRLPDKYRLPVVLCYLEGRSNEEAAVQLSWPKGTVAGRLSRARELLRRRLERRGLLLTSEALALALAGDSAAVAAPLAAATCHAAYLFALGEPTASAGVSAAVIELTKGVLKTMWHTKVKFTVVTALVLATVGLGAGWAVSLVTNGRSVKPPVVDAAPLPAEDKPAAKPDVSVRKLTFKNPGRLPEGARDVKTYGSLDEATKALGEDVTKQFAGQIDFAKEQLVRVRWDTSGPPFGTLEHRVSKDKDGPQVVFHVKEPNVQVRGQALKIGEDYFAVTAKIKVSLGGGQADKQPNKPEVPPVEPEQSAPGRPPARR